MITNNYVAGMFAKSLQMLDKMLTSIAAPSQISRLTRAFSERNDWKAREWENFVLYYSVPVFSTILNKEHFEHWLLFARGLYKLLKSSIHVDELNKVHDYFVEFVRRSEELFGLKVMTYNMHQLLHICKSVADLGPLWAHSTFAFESANHDLMQAIKCAKGTPQQIARYVNLNHNSIISLEHVYSYASTVVKFYCDIVLESRSKNVMKSRSTIYFGKGFVITGDQVNYLHLSKNARFFDKMVKNGCLYESKQRCKQRSNNSFAQLRNGKYIRICRFIFDQEQNKEFIVCNFVETCKYYFEEMQCIVKIEEKEETVKTEEMKTVCVFMNVDSKLYLSAVSNLWHY